MDQSVPEIRNELINGMMITFINRQTYTHTQHWRCNFKRTKCEQLQQQKKIQETSDFDDDNDDDDNLDDDNSRFFQIDISLSHTHNKFIYAK